MIELIFVIIIIAILAGVVIFKINSYRNDAYDLKQYSNFKTLIDDLNTYYLTKGKYLEENGIINIKKMTNVRAANNNDSFFVFDSSDKKACFLLTVDTKGKLYVQYVSKKEKLNNSCKRLLKVFEHYGIDFDKDEYRNLLFSSKDNKGI